MISCENLVLKYGDRTLLKLPEFQFEEKGFYVLLGRNGSGKSSFLRLLAGMESPYAGQLFLQNKAYSTWSRIDFAQELALLQSKQQSTAFMRGEEYVSLGRHPYLAWHGLLSKKDRFRVKTVMQELEIEQLAEAKVGHCSDGEKQLLGLARVLVQDTPILLLDEISAHLDFINKKQSFRRLNALAQDKLIILVSHELALAEAFADYILVLENQGLLALSPQGASQKLEEIFEQTSPYHAKT
ncbi:ABC transporter ATP-binding protein [Saprospira sp. CCB-QB6]|uniref:ABC transporter ATP-binding protein n=1 Tax=Saprospira sp. CCB-QB6 TaxID=3023936 RepID=UPI00234AAA6C|nr:ABC transporter ATP-binding protein [Saprospira sp. CCB-QB6]WCL82149.1 ABC transporter ATP-binding protein [Saprospira sp. CCB-QB6]